MDKKENRARIISGLEVRKITEEDSDRVSEFMAKYFSKQNPLRETFGTSTDRAIQIDQHRIRAKVNDGVSLGVFVKGTNELVYVEMNSVATKTNHGKDPEFTDLNKKEQAMEDFVEFIEGDIFKDLKTEKILWLSMGAVAENYRGYSLSSLLGPLRDQLAASKGCEYLATLTVSNFSQRASEKQVFITLREIKFSDYVDPKTGLKPDLKLSPINTSAAVMYKRVEAQNCKGEKISCF